MSNRIRGELNNLIEDSEEDIQVILTSDSAFYRAAKGNNDTLSRSERAAQVADYVNDGKEVLAYVSIHGNDLPSRPEVSGFEVYHIGDSSLAGDLSSAIDSAMTIPNRGVLDGSGIGGVKLALDTGANTPSALIEFGFISNEADNAQMSDSSIRQAAAEEIAQVLFDYAT